MRCRVSCRTARAAIPWILLGTTVSILCAGGAADAQIWEFSLEWGGTGAGPGEFLDPRDVAVDAAGLVYVADGINGRIQVFTEDGQFVREWRGSGYSTLEDPRGIAIDGDVVYTLEAVRCRLQKWTLMGEYIDRFVVCSGPSGIEQSYGVAARDGAVYVACNGGVRVFTEDLEFVGNIGGGALFWFDVEVDSDGTLWCSAPDYEPNYGIMRHYSTSGDVLAEWSTLLPGETQSRPKGVSLTSSGNVIVVESEAPLFVGGFKEFRPDGTFVASAQQNLRPYTEGIQAVGNDTVYVVSSGSDHIVKYSRIPVAVESSTWGGIKAIYGR